MTSSSSDDEISRKLALLKKIQAENESLRRENDRLTGKLSGCREYAEDLRRQVEKIGRRLDKTDVDSKCTQTEDRDLILGNGSKVDTKWRDSEAKSIVDEVKEIAASEARRQFLDKMIKVKEGLYLDENSGYYYDSERSLYYDGHNGIYYEYDYEVID